jgi:hypothetical protein
MNFFTERNPNSQNKKKSPKKIPQKVPKIVTHFHLQTQNLPDDGNDEPEVIKAEILQTKKASKKGRNSKIYCVLIDTELRLA